MSPTSQGVPLGDPPKVGWPFVDTEGPCVDPYDEGPHMAHGGHTAANRIAEPNPPLMCQGCWDRLMADTR